MTPDTLLAYFAGLFDGEGSVFITRAGGYDRLQATVTNTVREPLDRIVAIFGGNVVTAGPRSARHRILYRWAATGPTAAAFLRSVRPWLIIKAEQADIGLVFQTRKRAGRYCGARHIPDEERAWRAEQRSKLTKRNRPLAEVKQPLLP